MANSDVKAKRFTATGALSIGRARIRHVTALVSNAGAGRLTITEGNGGATILDVDMAANGFATIDVPDEGILCAADPYVSAATNITAATIFWS